jgi:hypothetical protein
VQLMDRVQPRRWQLTGLFLWRRGLEALSVPFPHELVIFRRARSGRDVRGQAAKPLGDVVDGSVIWAMVRQTGTRFNQKADQGESVQVRSH